MKEESILRQLTHTAVMMIGGFLDPARQSESVLSFLEMQADICRPQSCSQ
jgi:exportin-5